MSISEKFKCIKKHKQQMNTRDLCGSIDTHPKTYRLFDFINEIMIYDFEETPNYSKLVFMLKRTLLD